MGRGRRESGWRWWLWTKARQGQYCSLFLMTPIHGASFHLCLVILVVSSFFADVRNSEDPNWGCFFPESIHSRLCWVPRSAAALGPCSLLCLPLELCQVSASALHLARQGLSSIWWGSPFPPLDSPFVYVLCLGLNIQLTTFPPSL